MSIFIQSSRPSASRLQDARWQSGMRKKQESGTVLMRRPRRDKKSREVHANVSWKVAYADFTTAMMAFFLLMWILVSTDQIKREAIAGYFNPTVVTFSHGDGRGGAQITPDGTPVLMSASPSAPQQILEETPAVDPVKDAKNNYVIAINRKEYETRPEDLTQKQRLSIAEQLERQEFERAARDLRQAIQSLPELKDLEKNLVTDMTSEGFRIQLIDQDKTEMFPLGSAELTEPGKKLMLLVSQVIKKMPNKIAITGNTDAKPYRGDNGYTNWELSVDRANASRRALITHGVPPERLSSVVGKADTQLFDRNEPFAPVNRRISFVLLSTQIPQEVEIPKK